MDSGAVPAVSYSRHTLNKERIGSCQLLWSDLGRRIEQVVEAIAIRLEAIAIRLEAIALRLEAIASRLEASPKIHRTKPQQKIRTAPCWRRWQLGSPDA